MVEKNNSQKIKLSFYGGAGSVTGANFLFEYKNLKILIDCGFMQGSSNSHEFNSQKFLYNPSSIDMLFVTHAHIDHIGRIPKLVKDGFKGKIYSTLETKELAEFMLLDSANLLKKEAQNEKKEPLFTEENVYETISLWHPISYHTKKEIGEGVSVFLKDSGHILGSSMIEFSIGGKKIVFTGDLGNSPSLLLKDTEDVTDADYMVMESVYGDRNHETKDERLRKFVEVVIATAKRKGVLVIPAFSLERSQEILFQLNNLMEEAKIPLAAVFLDSPLAIKITRIYQKYSHNFNDAVVEKIKKGDDIFSFPQMHFTITTEESRAIKDFFNPKIIIAGSGMSNGGRVLHHEKNYLPDPNNTILIMGYEAAGTLGRQLQDGVKNVSIFGDQVPVRARIEMVQGYSSHKDSDHLMEFVSKTAGRLKKVFVAMGEPQSSLFLIQKLRDNLGVNAVYPEIGKTYEL